MGYDRGEWWHFTGQEVGDFPRWLTFCNFATDADRTHVLIHVMFGVIRVERGQWLFRRTDGDMRVSSNPPARAKPANPEWVARIVARAESYGACTREEFDRITRPDRNNGLVSEVEAAWAQWTTAHPGLAA